MNIAAIMRSLAVLFSIFVLTSCASGSVGNRAVPEPAKAVELERYLGKWYEIARYENRFEKGCEAVTAEYSKREDGLVGVINTCRKGTIHGPIDKAEGKAKIVEGSNVSKLKVSFFGPFYFGDYWILDRASDYSWAIVGEPSGRYLWILTRNSDLSKKEKAALYSKAESLGYDTSLLRETKH